MKYPATSEEWGYDIVYIRKTGKPLSFKRMQKEADELHEGKKYKSYDEQTWKLHYGVPMECYKNRHKKIKF